VLTSFTIITTTATDDVGRIHDGMPMTVTPDNRQQWLDPRLDDVDTIQGLMAPPTGLEIYAISKAVDDVRNGSAQKVVTAPRGASGGHCVIARRTRGSTGSFFDTGAVDRPQASPPPTTHRSVTTKIPESVTDVLTQNRHRCPAT